MASGGEEEELVRVTADLDGRLRGNAVGRSVSCLRSHAAYVSAIVVSVYIIISA